MNFMDNLLGLDDGIEWYQMALRAVITYLAVVLMIRIARLSSVYAILAFVTVPFFVFIMPRIVESLHPDPIINSEGKIKMDGKMLAIFLTSIFAFSLLYVWMYNLKVRSEKILYKISNKEASV